MPQAIQCYYGEFLTSPIPLEMSLIEPCDYACAYCFAVLSDRHQSATKGTPIRENGTTQAYKLLSNYKTRKTLEATLLQQDYPVLVSNRTDPFGMANRSATIPLLRVMTEIGLQVAIQTKGFKKPDDMAEVLSFLPPSCWYISIAFDNDDARARVEPGATTLQHRLDLISTLREHGHEVVIGVNPCVPEWMPNYEAMLAEFYDRGAWGIWAERLHLNHWQEKQLRPREKAALGADLIVRAKKRNTTDKDFDHFLNVLIAAQQTGLEPYSMGQPLYSNFWEPYKRLYRHTFPTLQDFINHCHETKPDGAVIPYSEFAAWVLPHCPKCVVSAGHYIGATTRQVTREGSGGWSNQMTYDHLLKMVWSDKRIKMSPINAMPFAIAAKAGQPLQGTDGLPLLVWSPDGHDSNYAEVE